MVDEKAVMTLTLHSDPIPLRLDDTGTVRVGQSRVPFENTITGARDPSLEMISRIQMPEAVWKSPSGNKPPRLSKI